MESNGSIPLSICSLMSVAALLKSFAQEEEKIVREQVWEMQGVECPAGELCQFSRRTATESWDPLAKADDVHAACVGGTPEQIIAAF